MEKIYLGSGNFTGLHCKLGSEIQDLSNETRFVIESEGETLDSSTNPTYFDWSTDDYVLEVKLGEFNLEPGLHNIQVRSYNPTVDPFFVWGELVLEFV